MAKVLVCDDDKEIVEAIEIYLTQEGYEVLKAYDGEEAMEVGEHSAAREKYPLQLISEHSRFRTHTQWGDVKALMEVDDQQYLYISPDDAVSHGIADGDKVRVFNDRGEFVTYARVRPNNPQGIVSAVKGWRADQVISGHLSNLGTKKSNGFCANQPFNDVAVAIEKA